MWPWLVFGLALGMAVTLTACDNSDSQKNNGQSQGGQSNSEPSEQHPAPDVVRSHAPEPEKAILDAKAAFDAYINAPNDIVRDEIQKKKSAAWKNAVLAIGDFENWTAYVSSIDSDGRIELRLSQKLVLKLWADAPRGGNLFSTIRTLREGQPVYISGRIAATTLDAMKASDDDGFPTCFEDGLGSVGCEIDLKSIRPLSASTQNPPPPSADNDSSAPIARGEAELADALKDPKKMKLMECMGVKVYEDPQPPGHPPSADECAQIMPKVPKPAVIPDKIVTENGATARWHTNPEDAVFCAKANAMSAMSIAASQLLGEGAQIEAATAGRSFCESNAPGLCTPSASHTCHATVIVASGFKSPGNFYFDDGGNVTSFRSDAQQRSNGEMEP